MPDSILKKQSIANLFCILQLVIYVLNLTIATMPIVAMTLVLFLPINLFLIAFIHHSRLYKIDITIILSTLAILLAFTASSPNEYTSKFSYLPLGLNAFFISILFQGVNALKLIYYFNLALNIIVFYLAVKSGFNPYFGDDIIINASRNIVNGYLIFGIVYYLFFCITLDKKIYLPLILLFTINCILLYGRSGIAISTMLLAFSIFKVYRKPVIAIISLFLLFSFNYIYQYIVSSTKFSSGLESVRPIIYDEYFSLLSLTDIVFGRSIHNCCSFIVSLGGNPHNSFLHGHMFHGIAHTGLFVIITLVIILTKNINLIFLMLILYLRHSLDWLGLFSITDAVIFSIFIYSYRYHLNRNS